MGYLNEPVSYGFMTAFTQRSRFRRSLRAGSYQFVNKKCHMTAVVATFSINEADVSSPFTISVNPPPLVWICSIGQQYS